MGRDLQHSESNFLLTLSICCIKLQCLTHWRQLQKLFGSLLHVDSTQIRGFVFAALSAALRHKSGFAVPPLYNAGMNPCFGAAFSLSARAAIFGRNTFMARGKAFGSARHEFIPLPRWALAWPFLRSRFYERPICT